MTEITLIDERKGWRDRTVKKVSADELPASLIKVKDRIESAPQCEYSIILQNGGHGKFFVNPPNMPQKQYSLFVMPDGIAAIN
ncbi:hypothetical protein LCGC14_1728170, partial [marine sediment metagenome]